MPDNLEEVEASKCWLCAKAHSSGYCCGYEGRECIEHPGLDFMSPDHPMHSGGCDKFVLRDDNTNCAICGKYMEKPMYSGEYADVCENCFATRFWDLIVQEKDKHLIIDGACYSVLPDGARGPKGFSGREFKFCYKDSPDEVHVTHNLWCQGPVPSSHRSDLQDNAFWVK